MSLPNKRPGDWICPTCNFLIFATKNSCIKCGTTNPAHALGSSIVNKNSGRHGGSKRFKRKYNKKNIDNKDNDLSDWMCPNCNFLIFAKKKSCKQCGAKRSGRGGRRGAKGSKRKPKKNINVIINDDDDNKDQDKDNKDNDDPLLDNFAPGAAVIKVKLSKADKAKQREIKRKEKERKKLEREREQAERLRKKAERERIKKEKAIAKEQRRIAKEARKANKPIKRNKKKKKYVNNNNDNGNNDNGNNDDDDTPEGYSKGDHIAAKALQNKYDYDYAKTLQNSYNPNTNLNQHPLAAPKPKPKPNDNSKDNLWVWDYDLAKGLQNKYDYNYAKSLVVLKPKPKAIPLPFPIPLASYNNSSQHCSGCIDGNGLVLMSNGKRKQISQLNIGDKVYSFPNNISTIKSIMTTKVNKEMKMVKLKNYSNDTQFFITYKHPVLINNNNNYDIDINKCIDINSLNENEINKYNLKWSFPKSLSVQRMRYQDNIYNFVLDTYHTINVNGYWCVTLGDDYYKGNNIGDPLWGSSVRINQYLNDIQSKPNDYRHIEIISDKP